MIQARPPSEISSSSPFSSNQDRSRLVYYANVVLARQQLGEDDASAVIFTVPPGVTFVLTNFSVFNTDSSSHTATIRLVPPQGVNDITNDYWEGALAGRTFAASEVEEVLTPGYLIVAFADVAAMVNIKINGVNLVEQ